MRTRGFADSRDRLRRIPALQRGAAVRPATLSRDTCRMSHVAGYRPLPERAAREVPRAGRFGQMTVGHARGGRHGRG